MNPHDPLPRPAEDGPGIAAPWQAELLALTEALKDRGIIGAAEWAEALGAALEEGATDASDYFDRWLMALETLLVRRGLVAAPAVAELADAWQRAAHATPHGQPIRLENDPQAPPP